MNKKIFLTSMVALMVACPAYAELTPDPGSNPPTQSGYINYDGTNYDSDDESCAADPLTYQGTSENYGTYTLTAQWDVDQCTIELDPNVANGGASSNTDPFATLYTTYNVGAYKDSARTNLMSTNSNGLSSAPIGKTVTLTANTNNPNSTNDITVSGGTLSGQLPFNGFFSAATGGTQYISQTNPYYILSAGDTAAKGVNTNGTGKCPTDMTWYAQYGCFQTTLPTASKPGYTFDGWYDAANNGNQVDDFCLDGDKTVYAHWTPKQYNIIYQPGNCAGSGRTISNDLTYDVAPNHTVLSPSDAQVSIPTGYVFDYWLANVDGDDNHWDPDEVYGSSAWQTDGNLVFTANCVPDTYTVTYVAGTNCSGSDSDTATYADPYTVQTYSAAGMTANTGYHLPTGSGWSSDWTNGTSTTPGTNTAGSINAGNITYYIPNDVTLTMPNCVANEYKVTYTCDNGTVNGILTAPNGETNPDAATFGDPYTFWSIDVCSAAGQTNSAWSCVGDTSGDTINQTTNAASWATAENVTCTMQYNADMVDLIWKYENGNPDTQNTCNYGNGNISIPANPTKTGYTFTGWKVTNWEGSSMVNN